ncbi:MAG: TetR/AcrR family transcriptional regulator [Anaerolineae bacterium]|nr:MAG: TetR/AcrR family transcriptional regulator [Anaerolineae bacterium]
MSSYAPAEIEKLDPRVKRTRELILRAFVTLLAEKGFQAITVQEITRRAEINRATFYAHFPDKYALLQYSIRHTFAGELQKRTLSACHYSPENLYALMVTVCDFIAKSGQPCKGQNGQFEALVEKEVREQVRALLHMWLQKSDLAADKAELLAAAAAWTIYGLARHWAGKRATPPDAFVREVLPLVQSLLFGEAILLR